MKNIVVFLVLLLQAGVLCAEQSLMVRSGVPCDGIPEIEQSLGSVEVAADAKGVSRYKRMQDGIEAMVVYRCDKGRLAEQAIIFTSSDRNEAHQIANKQRKRLVESQGEPIHDGLNLPTWKRMMYGILGADLDYLMSTVVWGRAEEDVMLQIRETEDKRWEIVISQGSSKMEYILNS